MFSSILFPALHLHIINWISKDHNFKQITIPCRSPTSFIKWKRQLLLIHFKLFVSIDLRSYSLAEMWNFSFKQLPYNIWEQKQIQPLNHSPTGTHIDVAAALSESLIFLSVLCRSMLQLDARNKRDSLGASHELLCITVTLRLFDVRHPSFCVPLSFGFFVCFLVLLYIIR